MKKKRKILITGGSGYLGLNLLKVLDQSKYEVHAVARSKKNIVNLPGIVWHFFDLLESGNSLRILEKVRPNYLIHLAWKIGHGLNHDSVDEQKIWLQNSKELITNFYSLGGKKAIVAGTCAEYSWKHNFMTEEFTPLTPTSDYGKIKVSLYDYVKTLCNEKGYAWSWPRIFFSFGPNQNLNSLVPSTISSIFEGNIIETSDGMQKFDYLYIHDVVSAFSLLIESDYDGEINVCSGKGTSVRELINLIQVKMGCNDLIKFGKKSLPKNSPTLIVGNNSKLLSLGWIPKYNLEQGISLTINKHKDKNG